MAPVLTGHCLCGAVQFEVDQPLLRAVYCHCTRCQRRTGVGAGCSGAAVPGSVRVVAGEHLITGYDPGDGWIKEFCSMCGGALAPSRGIRARKSGSPLRPRIHRVRATAPGMPFPA